MLTPNDKLREARERIASPADPTECLTRRELAEQANTWLWKRHNKVFVLTANYIGKLEQGVIRWPSKLYREAFRAILSAPNDATLGFVNPRRAAVKLDNVKRRQLFETTTVGVGNLALGETRAALLETSEPTPVPRRVGASDIAQIRGITQEFESWGNAYGGESIRDAVMSQLRWSAGLLDAICPERLRPELLSAVGALADTAGYIALDANALEQARRAFRFGVSCAEQAQDWPLRATVLDTMALQEIWTGQPDEALTLAGLALVRADRLAPAKQAMLHSTRGRALAKMHRVQDTLRAAGIADEHFAHATPDDDSLFMAFYTPTHHDYLTGRALADLAILGRDPSEATHRLAAAAAGYTTGYVLGRAICLAKLASLTMVTGDPLHAASIGHQALDITGNIRSHLATEDLRELARYAATHHNLEEVAHLRQRIGTLLVPTTDSP